jgi:hypothetical protein
MFGSALGGAPEQDSMGVDNAGMGRATEFYWVGLIYAAIDY